MSKKKIYFMGLLANTDSSILKVHLEHGFKINALSENEGVKFISNLEKRHPSRITKKLFMDFHCLSEEKKLYYIGNSFEGDIEMDDKGMLTSFPRVGEFDNKFVHGYLKPIIQLMRLFKEGNICMPLKYYYVIDDNIPKSVLVHSTGSNSVPELYTLKSSEIPDLHRFIQKTKLPFKDSFLQLAFENFELFYEFFNINLRFLSLMISLESLFNLGNQELGYRISRNAAVLLGEDKEDSQHIFDDIKDLYRKRSQIVHTGKSNIISQEDLLLLRRYVRGSIKEINNIGKSKSELLDLLNSCGFGERV